MERMEDLRRRIDEIDRQLVRLLNERTAAALEIGQIKASAEGGPGRVYVPEREVMVYSNILSANQGPLPDSSLKAIYDQIIEESRRLQSATRVQEG
jgi:chorismate mutase/prephenate dehydratase